MRDQQNGFSTTLELGELVEALVCEGFVTDGEHFVDEQDVGIDVDRHGESKTHVHAGGVGFHRRIDELAELGEIDDFVEARLDLLLRQSEHDSVDEDVLASGNLWMKARAEL